MKKYIVIVFLMGAGAARVFASDFSLSAGGGAYMGGLFTRYTLTADGRIDGEPVNVHADQEMNQFNYGGFLFVDGTWAEFSVGIQGGNNTFTETMTADSSRGREMDTFTSGDGTETMLNFELMFKYPFKLFERLTAFPLAGLEYQIALAQYRAADGRERYNRTDGIREADVNGNPYKLSMWNSLFVDIGAGMDFDLGDSLFIRTELLYGFRLQTLYENDALEKTKKGVNAPNPQISGLTSGPALKIATGWRF